LDRVQLSLVIGGVSLVGLAWAVIVVVRENLGSRNLALGTGTLLAAIALFIVQLWFELRATTAHDFISTVLTLDRKALKIQESSYSANKGIGMLLKAVIEEDSSAWLAKESPGVFREGGDHLFSDMTLFSLVNFMGINARDWQVRTNIYKKVPPVGIPYVIEPMSKDTECTILTDGDFKSRLEVPKNLFAAAPLIHMSRVCLPPDSDVLISNDSLTIRNPVCEVIFRVEPLLGSNSIRPGAHLGEPDVVPLLSNGISQFDTKQIGIRVTTTFFGLRSQRLDIAKYKEWADRLITGVREWFEG
jgi:hypothetical protein